MESVCLCVRPSVFFLPKPFCQLAKNPKFLLAKSKFFLPNFFSYILQYTLQNKKFRKNYCRYIYTSYIYIYIVRRVREKNGFQFFKFFSSPKRPSCSEMIPGPVHPLFLSVLNTSAPHDSRFWRKKKKLVVFFP